MESKRKLDRRDQKLNTDHGPMNIFSITHDIGLSLDNGD